jgi:hypothetical protein
MEAAVIQDYKERLWAAVNAAFGNAALVAIKDPRQCRFVPFVLDTLAEHGVGVRAVLVLRPPHASARSLEQRDGTTPAFAHMLWLRHMMDAELATRTVPRIAVDYDAMLQDWESTARQLLSLIDQKSMPDDAVAAAITAFIGPAQRHHHEGEALLEQPLAGLVARAVAALHMLVVQDDPTTRQALDGIRSDMDAARWLLDDVIHDELRHRRASRTEAPRPDAETVSRATLDAPMQPSLAEGVATIRQSGMFDEAWYRTTYPDACADGRDPIEHYITVGAARGLNPHPLFDTAYYARQMARRIASKGEA